MATTAQQPSYRKRIGYQAALLGGFSTIATILLVMGNLSTKDAILERQREDLQESLSQVVPHSYYSNNLLSEPLRLNNFAGELVTIYRGTAFNADTGKDVVSALAWEIVGQGYAGEMRFILGLDNQGTILGVRVLAHAETPGLGDKMEVAKDDWILDFDGLSLGNPIEVQWRVDKDGGQFDSFTGATITPRGIVAAILDALKFFKKHQKQLLLTPLVDVDREVNENLDNSVIKSSEKSVSTAVIKTGEKRNGT